MIGISGAFEGFMTARVDIVLLHNAMKPLPADLYIFILQVMVH